MTINPKPRKSSIPVVCGCARIACRLPSPEYDDISSLEIRCQYCGGANIVTTSRGRVYDRQYMGVLKYDELIDSDMQTDVPEASACIQEAVLSVNNNAFRAAMIMARAALEVTLQFAGFTDYYLIDKVSSAVTGGVLSPHDRTRATNVRLIGNFGAHGSSARYVPQDAQMSKTDAKYAVEASSEIVKKIVQWRRQNP